MTETGSGLVDSAYPRAGDEFLRFEFTLREWIDLAAELGAVPARRARQRDVRNVLIVAALLTTWRHPLCWIAYSRDRNFYSGARRYLGALASHAALVWAIETLVSADLIAHRKTRPGLNGRFRSTFRATQKLLERAPIKHVDQLQRVIFEPVRLKDETKRLCDYRDTAQTRSWREDLHSQNAVLQNVSPMLHSSDWEVDSHGLLRCYDRTLNPLRDQLHRVFNCDWHHGGRWYGAWWQDLSRQYRERILIDGHPVVELDYPHIHPTLLGAMCGYNLGAEDPYCLEGFERSDVKTAFNVFINADSEPAAILALRRKFVRAGRRQPHFLAMDLIAAVKQRHPCFERYWGTGIGRRLQCVDGEMCADIQRTMRENGSPVLSIHDSFIVQKSHRQRLQGVMDDVLDQAKRRLAAI